MLKRSSGILIYKIEDNKIKVLLTHPGGPYRKKQNIWGIPKGEIDDNESILECARREFTEETNLSIDNDINYLASKKVSHKKLVIIYTKEYNYDLSNCKSNTFKIEYPRGSKQIQEFPENDDFKYIDLEEAKKIIFKQQVFFLERLEKELNK